MVGMFDRAPIPGSHLLGQLKNRKLCYITKKKGPIPIWGWESEIHDQNNSAESDENGTQNLL